MPATPATDDIFSQATYDLRFAWGRQGLAALAPCDVLVIVDVLSFSTCVDVAVGRGARVLPFVLGHDDGEAAAFARTHGAVVAARRGRPGFTLSPASLRAIAPGTKLVLPSPNGSTLSTLAAAPLVLAGCLRNSAAVARSAARGGPRIGVVAAGEAWPDGGLRPALEDLLGAGAILAQLRGSQSADAGMAVAAFMAMRHALPQTLVECPSGRELIARGFADDVAIAAELDASTQAPRLVDGAYATGDAPVADSRQTKGRRQ